ncbi:hypothetical protein BC938DRAFT_481877 [Jimgerdemannia flammicorona]|uniref:F-box domain-containing protein n=1 Tax=Jimgerdemannia flammicorona TaxID=994334 RepID=A0A433QFU1_9FUNG|nr:hypothetical protein BC938DRAFT_481877 [Jimgerdemannia flammicorona]
MNIIAVQEKSFKAWGAEVLSPETWCAIASFLSPLDRVYLASTCSAMCHLLAGSASVWTTMDFAADSRLDEKTLEHSVTTLFEGILTPTAKLGVREVIFDRLKVSDKALKLVLRECTQLVIISLNTMELSFPLLANLLEEVVDSGVRLPSLQQFVIPKVLNDPIGFSEQGASPKFVRCLRSLAGGRGIYKLCECCDGGIGARRMTCDICQSSRTACVDCFVCSACDECRKRVCDTCVGTDITAVFRVHIDRVKDIVSSCRSCWTLYRGLAEKHAIEWTLGEAKFTDYRLRLYNGLGSFEDFDFGY